MSDCNKNSDTYRDKSHRKYDSIKWKLEAVRDVSKKYECRGIHTAKA